MSTKKVKSYWRVCEIAARFCREAGDNELAAYFENECYKFKNCTQHFVTQHSARALIKLQLQKVG